MQRFGITPTRSSTSRPNPLGLRDWLKLTWALPPLLPSIAQSFT